MICEKCKTQLPEGAKFCLECGSPVSVNLESSSNCNDTSWGKILDDLADTLDKGSQKLQSIFSDENMKELDGVFEAIDSVKTGANNLVITIGLCALNARLEGKDTFAGSNKFYFGDSIPSELLQNAMKTYGEACGVEASDVFLLCDDTLLMDKGTIGFMVGYEGIATSRKEMVKFTDIKKVYLDGYKLMVDKRNGGATEIYDIDGLNEGDRENLNGILDGISQIIFDFV